MHKPCKRHSEGKASSAHPDVFQQSQVLNLVQYILLLYRASAADLVQAQTNEHTSIAFESERVR